MLVADDMLSFAQGQYGVAEEYRNWRGLHGRRRWTSDEESTDAIATITYE